MTTPSPLSSGIPLIDRAAAQPANRPAILDAGRQYSYAELLETSARYAAALLQGGADLAGDRVAFLVPSSVDYVTVQWAIWRAGGIAVPLCTQHPAKELAYVIADCDAGLVVVHPEFVALVQPVARQLGKRFLLTTELAATAPVQLPIIDPTRGALMLYTSGTTNKPKGVVSTHASLSAQIASLVTAWEWSETDRSLLFLPLHHIHGVMNILCCTLWAGARCEIMRSFAVGPVWERIRDNALTVFMAVPTIYTRLIAAWEAASPAERETLSAGCRRLRLMVSGSAALPVTTFDYWQKISGHALLERYGMTELGMVLSNPLRGPRRPGHVGTPLPGVEVRLVDEQNQPVADDTPGEIQVRGATVFREYWRKPEATAAAFAAGWFRTGDVAVRHQGAYRILGRSSVDIIKTGGYKVSALEIEEELRLHPAIDQCAVVGVPDQEWGERVAVAIVLKPGGSLDLKTLRDWARQSLAVYKVPSLLQVVSELPRNAMGKVVKPDVSALFKAASQ